jgi:hypothetical protein
MSGPSHPSFYQSENIMTSVKITKPLFVHIPFQCYVKLFYTKYSPQSRVLKVCFFSYIDRPSPTPIQKKRNYSFVQFNKDFTTIRILRSLHK